MSERLRVLVADDEEKMCRLMANALTQDGHAVDTATSLARARELVLAGEYDLVFTDLKMETNDAGLALLRLVRQRTPRAQVVLVTGFASIEVGREALALGGYHSLIKPVKLADVRAIAQEVAAKGGSGASAPLASADGLVFDDIVVGRNPRMQTMYELLPRVVEGRSTVLIRGESGTGKEVIARAIHKHSSRSAGPFVDVNCAALVDTLLESELFGIEKRVATGVDARDGKLEQANRGTLFLDEIGDMSLAVQAKILRVLQEKQFVRVGGRDKIDVDVRVIAATNVQLEEAVRDRRFREDLYYRLSVVTLEIPPLRERAEDIAVFVSHFLDRINASRRSPVRGVRADALRVLTHYDWPGNVRELENALERAALVARGDTIGVDDLPDRVTHARSRAVAGGTAARVLDLPAAGVVLEDLERDLIVQALDRTGWRKAAAARLLGLTRRALGYRIEKFGLSAPAGADENAASEADDDVAGGGSDRGDTGEDRTGGPVEGDHARS